MNAWIAGSSLHTALGRTTEENVAALSRAPSSPRTLVISTALGPQSVSFQPLAAVTEADAELRLTTVLESCIEAALVDAGLSPAQRRATALLLGSSSTDVSVLEARYRHELAQNPQAVPLRDSSIGSLAAQIRRRFDLRGPDFSFSTGCTSSANALRYAAALVDRGTVQHALVVGLELYNETTVLGFRGLQLITDEVMRPFDRARRGLVPGEACAAAVISTQASSGWRIAGGANVCDAYGISTTNPDGSCVAQAMQQALSSADLDANDLAAIKVHGAASLRSDEAEVAGMQRVFESLPMLCALKPYLGHTFGACGLAELLLFCGAVSQGFLPATPGICAGDSDLPVTLNQQPRAQGPGNFMLNYFGFGGSNTSLIVTRHA